MLGKNQSLIGDPPCLNNIQGVILTPIQFSIEFIFRMRKSKSLLFNVPSSRQALAIPKLLTAMYYRKNILTPENFITSAVITTPIEDQIVAKRIATEILFPDNRSIDLSGSTIASPTARSISGKNVSQVKKEDLFDDFLAEVDDLGLDLNEINSQAFDGTADLKEFEYLMDFIQDFYEKAANQQDPFLSIASIFDQRQGYIDMLHRGINTLQKAQDHAHQLVSQSVQQLSPKDVQAATNLGWSDELLTQTHAPWIKMGLEYCAKSSEYGQHLIDLIKTADIGTCTKTLQFIKDLGEKESILKCHAAQIQQKIRSLSDVWEMSQISDQIPVFNKKKVFKQSLHKNLENAFDIARRMSSKFDSPMAHELHDQWAQQNQSPDLADLYHAQYPVPQWDQNLTQFVKDALAKISTSQDPQSQKNSAQINELIQNLMQYSERCFYSHCAEKFKEEASQSGFVSLKNCASPEEFIHQVKFLLKIQIPMVISKMYDIGTQKGISEERLMEIIGGSFEILKKLFAKQLNSHEVFSKLLDTCKSLSKSQLADLTQIAANNKNFYGLSALAHKDFSCTMNCISGMNQNAQNLFIDSLSAGPGENLLLQWFHHRRNIPKDMKKRIRELTKSMLIRIALNIVSNQRGTGEKGLIPTSKLRPYIEGDPMDLVDIDASIENIITSGKNLEHVCGDDLFVQDSQKGRVSICFLLDISGSMSGDKLAACSIATLVLIGHLKTEEVAIAFFESDTHTVKSFDDEKDLDDIADELLDLHARGGTQVQKALEWGHSQLESSTAEYKLCFLLTDCEFFESFNVVRKELEKYVNLRAHFLLGVNTRSYSRSYANLILDTTQGELLKILNIAEIPQIIMETLEKIG
ncbi:hypothetical protein NEF87_003928 [Candidatus Lokiarchaeum ossiferum]|uniref:VWFA domain-containing protein n=1 Tax=Candidatus Lokiarchaeum ossiferum TaxID=2951803 RepID=A0ABY6HWB3_9ARCH|nr:hypothetical protein NEF87_003928 [Candidatus Lokiarchaeum sp. B-35]